MSEALRKRLLDKTFKYTKASDTDIRRLFARIKRQQKDVAEAEQAAKSANVKPLRQKAGT